MCTESHRSREGPAELRSDLYQPFQRSFAASSAGELSGPWVILGLVRVKKKPSQGPKTAAKLEAADPTECPIS